MDEMKKNKSYSLETKLEAVRLFLIEGDPIKAVQERLGIQSDTVIEKWVRAYRRDGSTGLEPKPKGRPKKPDIPETTEEKIRRLEMENELLRSFLSELERK
jgi:transposase